MNPSENEILQINLKDTENESNLILSKEKTGRWSSEEHDLFLRGLELYGKEWKKISQLIKTRTIVQVRTHAQKYFQKMQNNSSSKASVSNLYDLKKKTRSASITSYESCSTDSETAVNSLHSLSSPQNVSQSGSSLFGDIDGVMAMNLDDMGAETMPQECSVLYNMRGTDPSVAWLNLYSHTPTSLYDWTPYSHVLTTAQRPMIFGGLTRCDRDEDIQIMHSDPIDILVDDIFA